MCIDRAHKTGIGERSAPGFSLIELILFILIVSVALLTVVKAFEVANIGSADPVRHRQSLAIAQALLEEIRIKSFAKPAGGFAGPFTLVNRNRFDTVTDFNGLTISPISDMAGNALAGLANYSASIEVVAAAFGNVPSAAGYAVTVTVTDPAGGQIKLTGYRANY